MHASSQSSFRRVRAPHVPIYAGETIAGRAYEMADGTWDAVMSDGSRLGNHHALIDAQAAILARHHAPGRQQSPRTT